jgi:WD40 repeat protein
MTLRRISWTSRWPGASSRSSRRPRKVRGRRNLRAPARSSLRFFCRGLNERRKRQGADRFDDQLLEGAQQSIIADYYRSCVEGLPDSVSRFIESDLITEKGFRNSYAKDDAVPAILTEEQLDRLINRRLLRVEERYGTARIELTHDLLTRAVMADRDRRRVEEEKATLARRAEDERQALAAQARTQRRRVMVMALVAVVCLLFGGFAAWQWRVAVIAERESDLARTVALEATRSVSAMQVTAIKARDTAVQERDKARRAEIKARTAESYAQTQARLAKESAAKELVARGSSEARRMETEARLVFDNSGEALVKATLLSIASVRSAPTIDGQISLTKFVGLLPRAPLWRRSVAQPANIVDGGRKRALALSPDGARLAVAGGSGPVQLLDTHTGQPLRSFDVQRNPADRTVLAFSPNGAFLVLGCAHQACVLNAATGQLLARLPSEGAHGSMVWSASFAPDGKSLALSSYGSGEVLVYDVATWHTTATISTGVLGVYSAVFSPKGEWIATASGSALQLWRVGHYEVPAAEGQVIGLIWSIAFQSDGLGLITAGQEVQTWRIMRDDPSRTRLEADASKPVKAHTVIPWGKRPCFAADAPDSVHLFCLASLVELLRVPVSSAAAVISPDARWLFNEQSDGILAAWSLEARPDAFSIPIGAPVRSMAVAEHGGWLAAGTDGGEVAIVGLDSRKERRRLRLAPETQVDKVIASSDGRWLVVAQSTSLHVFDTSNWREVASKRYEDYITGAAFDPGSRRLFVMTGTTVVVWEAGGWREQRHLEHDGIVNALRVSPSGRQFATATNWPAGHDGGVNLTRVFDLESGNETAWEYTSGGGNISQPAMRDEAARRKRALAGGDIALVREAASSWPALELKEPDQRVSGDGVWKVSFSGSEATLRDVVSGRTIGTFDHGADIASVHFVPALAPRWLVSAGDDGTLALWPMRTDDLVHEACARLRAIFDPQALKKLIADAHAEGSCEAK